MGCYLISINFFDPLEQFNLILFVICSCNKIWNFSNILLVLVIIFSCLGFYNTLLLNIPFVHWIFSVIKILFNFLINICKTNLNISVQIFLPFFCFTFLFILLSNFFGLIPYTFTLTSHLSITFFLALSFFIGINIFGILMHGLEYFNLFLPSSSPLLINPLLILVEIISYFARVFSLSIRLFANMMAGHALLKILASFSFLFFNYGTPGLMSIGFVVALLILIIIGLEFLIAFLQAYVFFMLMVVYLNDLIFIGH